MKKEKTIKAWVAVDKDTGEICYFLNGRQIELWRYKKDALFQYNKDYFKIVKVELKILDR